MLNVWNKEDTIVNRIITGGSGYDAPIYDTVHYFGSPNAHCEQLWSAPTHGGGIENTLETDFIPITPSIKAGRLFRCGQGCNLWFDNFNDEDVYAGFWDSALSYAYYDFYDANNTLVQLVDIDDNPLTNNPELSLFSRAKYDDWSHGTFTGYNEGWGNYPTVISNRVRRALIDITQYKLRMVFSGYWSGGMQAGIDNRANQYLFSWQYGDPNHNNSELPT